MNIHFHKELKETKGFLGGCKSWIAAYTQNGKEYTMKRTSIMGKALLLGTAFFMFLLPVNGQPKIFSDITWTTYDKNANDVGKAQEVCLSEMIPSKCPAGATAYGYPSSGWTANLTSISGAKWIWARDITGATSPAANAEFTFKKDFYFCEAPPEDGMIYIAADDFAEVKINGNLILTSTSNSVLSSATFSRSSVKIFFPNTIEVKVKNGSNPPGCGSDQYHCNPAGFVFGIIFPNVPKPPACISNGLPTLTGDSEQASCTGNMGQVGIKERLCVCGNWLGWSSCFIPPPPPCKFTSVSAVPSACDPATDKYSLDVAVKYSNAPTGDIEVNGQKFPSNGSGLETFTLTGLTANGAAGVPVNAAFAATCSASTTYDAPVNCTCIGNNGVPFSVGATETLPCPARCGSEQTRTCLLNVDSKKAEWGGPFTGCKEMAKPGEWCGTKRENLRDVKCCPDGFHCATEPTIIPCNTPWWCFFTFGIPKECKCKNKKATSPESTEWICLPD